MNRFKYLEILSGRLCVELPEDEYSNVMQYYTEYFAEAGAEKEYEVLKELGSPEDLAKKIIAEYKGKTALEPEVTTTKKKGLPIGWIIFIAIVGSPLWLALFFVALGLIIAVIAVMAALICVAAAGLVAGTVTVIGGIAMLFNNPANGILTIGTGFLFGTVGIGAILLSVLLIRLIIKLIKYISSKSSRKEKK